MDKDGDGYIKYEEFEYMQREFLTTLQCKLTEFTYTDVNLT